MHLLFYTAGCGELTIDHVQIAYSDSQFVGSVATLTCDIGDGFVFAVNEIVFSDESDISEQRTCTMNQGWTLNGFIRITCIRTSNTTYRGAAWVYPLFLIHPTRDKLGICVAVTGRKRVFHCKWANLSRYLQNALLKSYCLNNGFQMHDIVLTFFSH